MKKMFILPILILALNLQGCGLQKIIEQAINKLKSVEIVTGTITTPNSNDYSGTKIEINGRTTHTNVNGEFRLLINGSPAQSVNEMIISHAGFVTENVTIPAETENGEYTVSEQLSNEIYNTPVVVDPTKVKQYIYQMKENYADCFYLPKKCIFSDTEIILYFSYDSKNWQTYQNQELFGEIYMKFKFKTTTNKTQENLIFHAL
jgi:hypothetical protein